MGIQQSFDRIAILKVFKRDESKSAAGTNILQNVDPSGRAFASRLSDGGTGFRITFNVNKTNGPTPVPNLVTFSIYNLGPDSRALVTGASGLNNLVILQAGYGNSPQLIFAGNISYGYTRKVGPDYISDIHAGDGLFAFQNSMVNQSFDKGVSVNSLLNTLTGQLSNQGVDKGVVQGAPNAIYNQGFVLSGKTCDRLREICDRHDLNFSIQDGKVTIIPYGGNNGNPTFLISPETGLIGTPEIRATDIRGNNLISFRCLLNPKINPFQQVLVASKFVNGVYTCSKVVHTGDSFGGPWFTDVEASNQVAA